MNPLITSVCSFGATFLAAFAGSVASIQAGSFYAALSKPSWAPPASVFGPVWTVLYLMMAVAAAVAWTRGVTDTRSLVSLFIVQLALNALWSWAFFRWESGLGSMAIIVLLWLAIVGTLAAFWKASPVAGALMVPYFAWVTFAAVLNAAICRLNPEAL